MDRIFEGWGRVGFVRRLSFRAFLRPSDMPCHSERSEESPPSRSVKGLGGCATGFEPGWTGFLKDGEGLGLCADCHPERSEESPRFA